MPDSTHQITTTAETMVDALNDTFGRHAGARASHAKGLFATGEFVPDRSTASLLTSPLFTELSIPATVRFSIAGGNPNVSDKAQAARGMSIDLRLTNGERLVLLMISAPVFFAATPESFVSFLEARRPDTLTGKPDADVIARSNLIHTDSEAQRRWLAATAPSSSFATAPYFPVHTYNFDCAQGDKRPARWIFEPMAGRIGLSKSDIERLDDNYLGNELSERFSQMPIEWRVLLQFPEDTDALRNVTVAWSENRVTREVGRFRITGLTETEQTRQLEGHVFDPEKLPTGIAPYGDPIFGVRSGAYSISEHRRRLGEGRAT